MALRTLERRDGMVISITPDTFGQIVEDYGNMDQMADVKDIDPVLLEKVRAAEAHHKKVAPAEPSLLIKKTDTHSGIRGLKDVTHEHHAAVAEETLPTHKLFDKLNKLDIAKREGEKEYEEAMEKYTPEIKEEYLRSKNEIAAQKGYYRKFREHALQHGIDLSAKKPEDIPQPVLQRIDDSILNNGIKNKSFIKRLIYRIQHPLMSRLRGTKDIEEIGIPTNK